MRARCACSCYLGWIIQRYRRKSLKNTKQTSAYHVHKLISSNYFVFVPSLMITVANFSLNEDILKEYYIIKMPSIVYVPVMDLEFHRGNTISSVFVMAAEDLDFVSFEITPT